MKQVVKGDKNGITIPRESLLIFKADSSNGRGEGVSPLTYVYDTWRDYQRFKDLEGINSIVLTTYKEKNVVMDYLQSITTFFSL